jgi:hypothetical protein
VYYVMMAHDCPVAYHFRWHLQKACIYEGHEDTIACDVALTFAVPNSHFIFVYSIQQVH